MSIFIFDKKKKIDIFHNQFGNLDTGLTHYWIRK